jgi:Icc-related predicted phosphoesterase
MRREEFYRSRTRLRIPAVVALVALSLFLSFPVGAADYRRIVVIADTHVSGEHLERQEEAIRQINAWDDVDLVAVLGDLCFDMGTDGEYAQAKALLSKLTKPLYPVVGNHDYIYDGYGLAGVRKKGTSNVRREKQRKFREVFGLESSYYKVELGPYLLIFLSADHPTSRYLTEISDEQLSWFEGALKENPGRPTVVFFHGPLKGTILEDEPRWGDPGFFAQPQERIRPLLANHPQVVLWVAGHLHLSPQRPSFRHEVNFYESRLLNIHTPNMNRQTIWTNSLYLYPNSIVVRTFDHRGRTWLEALDRRIPLPLH